MLIKICKRVSLKWSWLHFGFFLTQIMCTFDFTFFIITVNFEMPFCSYSLNKTKSNCVKKKLYNLKIKARLYTFAEYIFRGQNFQIFIFSKTKFKHKKLPGDMSTFIHYGLVVLLVFDITVDFGCLLVIWCTLIFLGIWWILEVNFL